MLCPDENVLIAFLGGAGSSDRARIADHVRDCDDCRVLCRALSSGEQPAVMDQDEQLFAAAGGVFTARPELAPGALLGHFEIVKLLASGGMGQVYEALDCDLERRVAIKLLSLASSPLLPDLQWRLVLEAKALARVQHENVVAVYEAGNDGNDVFIAMELVEGQPLDRWLVDEKRSWREIAEVFLRAGRGLWAAHSESLVHRDFKPQNVMVSSDGRVKVIDFGLVRAAWQEWEDATDSALSAGGVSREASDQSMTVTGAVLGTPAYASPEQLSGDRAGAASDVFSFCVSLFEALHGARPFSGATPVELLQQMRAGTILRGRARVPARLQRCTVAGLAFEPDKRPGLDEILHALRASLGRTRRLATVSLGVAGAVMAALVGRQLAATRQPSCSGGEALFAAHWTASDREAVHAALTSSELPYADESFSRISSVLEDYGRRWTLAHRQVCEATAVDEVQPRPLLEARMACLEQRLRQVSRVVGLMRNADRQIAKEAVYLTNRLPTPLSCQTLEVSQANAVEGLSDDDAARRERILDALELANTQRESGRLEEALQRVVELAADASKLGDPRLLGRLHYVEGLIRVDLGDTQRGVASLKESLWAAEAAGDLDAEIVALSALVMVTGERKADLQAAEDYQRHALALLERVDHRPYYEADLRYSIARSGLKSTSEIREQLVVARDRVREVPVGDEARDSLEDSIELALAQIEDQIALGKNRVEVVRENIPVYEEILARQERRYGPHHHSLLPVLGELGESYEFLGDEERARAARVRALNLEDKPLAIHSRYSRPLLAAQMLEPGDEQIRKFQEAVDVSIESMGEYHSWTGDALYYLAEGYAEVDRHEEAEKAARRALNISTKVTGPTSNMAIMSAALLATILTKRGRFEEASELVSFALEGTKDDESRQYLRIMPEIARVELEIETGDWANALAHTMDMRKYFEIYAELMEEHDRMSIDFVEAMCRYELGEDRAHNLEKTQAIYRSYSGLPAADQDQGDLRNMHRWLARRGALPVVER